MSKITPQTDKRRAIDYDDAMKYGVAAAFILYRFRKLIELNSNRKLNYYYGHYWSYDTIDAIAEWFPFYDKRTVQRALKTLKDAGEIKSMRNPKKPFDSTQWYTMAKWHYPDPNEQNAESQYESLNDYSCDEENSLELTHSERQNVVHDNDKETSSNNDKMASSSLYNQTQSDMHTSNKFDFECVYEQYPKKAGKTRGVSKCKATIKTKRDYLLLLDAIKNYKRKIEIEETPKQYIKQFDTFMSCWRDYLDSEVVKENATSRSKIIDYFSQE